MKYLIISLIMLSGCGSHQVKNEYEDGYIDSCVDLMNSMYRKILKYEADQPDLQNYCKVRYQQYINRR